MKPAAEMDAKAPAPHGICRMSSAKKKIWIDMDNSPHVPFFNPIIRELEKRGYSIVLTVRDCFQVCGLADMTKLNYKKVGRHYGKSRVLKVAGLFLRALQLLPIGLRERPLLALSHGSRAQILAASILRLPAISMDDYEYSREIVNPSWLVMPEVIPERNVKAARKRVFRYPGIKEDVYVPFFRPDPGLRDSLGLGSDELVVTIRPPATEAHYHNPLSEELFKSSLDFLASKKGTRIVVLPRGDNQKEWIERKWGQRLSERKIVIPDKVVDGLSLIWCSDLVISGGGTMNREAAALGVPVYSIFSGMLGAVDQYLCSTGRLTLLRSEGDIRNKIALVRRPRSAVPRKAGSDTLKRIVKIIDDIGNERLSAGRAAEICRNNGGRE